MHREGLHIHHTWNQDAMCVYFTSMCNDVKINLGVFNLNSRAVHMTFDNK